MTLGVRIERCNNSYIAVYGDDQRTFSPRCRVIIRCLERELCD